ncbi:hypothetical protein JOD82_005504 [Paenibacillus sp. 1182]|uniref:hypothetical protein n=1 Tax=Paenibacillus sp. 1182 TaxID=2806565 RepID=UPI001AEAE404|nr:hypothetical protein [Paenibacillus sp. 1182]MBP1312359.1 hypothetical protein [Paenibacillus sp. 1182]
MKWKLAKKTILSSMATALLFSVITPFAAFAETSSVTATYGTTPTIDANTVTPPAPTVQPDGEVSTQGVKVKAVETAIKALRYVIDNPVSRWTLEKFFDTETVAAVIKYNNKVFGVLESYLGAVELTTAEIAAGARSAIVQELRGVVSKGIAEGVGMVVEWLIYYGSKVIL